MRRILTLLVAMTWMASPGYAQQAQLHLQRDRGKAIADHYIVVLKDGASADAVAQRHGASPSHVYTRVLNGFATELSRGQLQQLLRDADVQYVDEDGVVQATQLTPGSVAAGPDASADINPLVVQPGATWGIDKLDQEFGAGTNGSYNYTDTGVGVNVYVVDTGIRTTHNEFDGAALNRAKAGALGFDAFGGNGQDCNGHGTHVSGTIGGTTYGVAKAVKLYSVRVLDCSGNGTWAGFIAGADWVTNNHVKPAVANASLGGGFIASANAAVAKSVSWGVTWVVAAGNFNDNACNYSPSSEPSAITVGATDSGNNKAGFSNWGPCVDINGPGVSITSSWNTSDSATAVLNGTSMASPHVAGLAALYHKALATAAPGQVGDVLEDSAVNGVIAGLVGGTPNLLAHKVNGTIAPGGVCVNGGFPQEPDLFSGQCYYFSTNPGYHHVWVRGTPGTNFNVEFYQWNGSAWIKKAQKITGSTNEYLKYYGAGGFFYMYLVKSVSGTGTYDSWVIRPD
jgi:aqualysin 1